MKLSVSKRNQLIQKIDLGQEVLTFDYSETIFLIGRSKDCHVVLDDKQISREHSHLIHKNGKWEIEQKADESAGIFLNGEKVTKSELVAGDVLSIGPFQITIEEIAVLNPPKEVTKTTEIVTQEPIIKEVIKIVEVPVKVEVPVEAPKTKAELGEVTQEIQIPEELNSPSVEETGDLESEFASESDDVTEEQLTSASLEALNNSESEFSESLDSGMGEAEGSLEAPVEDQAYSLENIDSESSDDDSTKVLNTFATAHLELFGETAPYDKFLIEKDKTFIGRDPSKCQIVLNDPEVSSVHAVITKTKINLTIEDLKSGNGTLLNGKRINQSILNHNDEFIVGGVTFTVKFRSQFLKEENDVLMPVADDQSIEVEEVVEVEAEDGEEVDALGESVDSGPEEKSIIKRILKDEKKRKMALYAIVGAAAYWFLSEDPPPPPKPTPAEQSKTKDDGKNAKNVKDKKADPNRKILTEEERRSLSPHFQIGKKHFQEGRYTEALDKLEFVASKDPLFHPSLPTLIAGAKEGLKKIEELERKRKEAEELEIKRKKLKDLLESARKYTAERNVVLAQDVFNKIIQLDPDNYEAARLKRELESWERENERKAEEEKRKKKEREDKIEKFKPAKNLYIQGEWFKAIAKLDDFLKIQGMDEDLVKEASDYLKISKEKINEAVGPLMGKAKSLQEGQDLKGAYEVYQQVIRVEPSNTEAISQITEIRDQLTIKARRVYREAIISESLSLFQDAKEKFQEVQQISPVDSEYYKKASDKLKDYLD